MGNLLLFICLVYSIYKSLAIKITFYRKETRQKLQ